VILFGISSSTAASTASGNRITCKRYAAFQTVYTTSCSSARTPACYVYHKSRCSKYTSNQDRIIDTRLPNSMQHSGSNGMQCSRNHHNKLMESSTPEELTVYQRRRTDMHGKVALLFMVHLHRVIMRQGSNVVNARLATNGSYPGMSIQQVHCCIALQTQHVIQHEPATMCKLRDAFGTVAPKLIGMKCTPLPGTLLSMLQLPGLITKEVQKGGQT